MLWLCHVFKNGITSSNVIVIQNPTSLEFLTITISPTWQKENESVNQIGSRRATINFIALILKLLLLCTHGS